MQLTRRLILTEHLQNKAVLDTVVVVRQQHLTDARVPLQMAALSKAVTPLKRVLPLRMNLMKGLVRGRLARSGGTKPATASAFVNGPGAPALRLPHLAASAVASRSMRSPTPQ